MKPRALLLVLLAFAASTLSAADKLDALRKAGAKISTSPDGSVSIHFSVPKPPSGPFGEPIFDPNFRPSPPLEAAQLETLANIPKLRSLKLSGIALRPKAFETLEILTAPATSVPSTYETYGASTTRASPTSPPSRPSTSRIAEPSPTPDSHPSPSSRTCALSAYVPPKSPTTVSPPSLKPVTWRPSYLSSRASMAPDSFISNTFQSLPSSALTPTATPQTRHKSTYPPLAEGFLALQALKVGGNNLTDAHLASVATVKNLQTLTFRTLDFTKFTDAGMAQLANLSNLRELRINGSVKVTDAGMVHLTTLNQLEKLDLGRTRISSAAAASLGKLPALKELEVVGSGFGPDGIQALRKLNPKVRVTLHRPLN